MKWLAKMLATTLVVVIVSIALEFGVNGVPLFRIPKADDVAAITVTHPRCRRMPSVSMMRRVSIWPASCPIFCAGRRGDLRKSQKPARSSSSTN